MPAVTFLPDEQTIEVATGTPLLHVFRSHQIEYPLSCGGVGTCGKCRIQVVTGDAPPTHQDNVVLGAEALQDGWRLACRLEVQGDLVISLDHFRSPAQRILTRFSHTETVLDPGVEATPLTLPAPSHEDPRPDWPRLQQAFCQARAHGPVCIEPCPLPLLQRLPGVLRRHNWTVTVLHLPGSRADTTPSDVPGDAPDHLLSVVPGSETIPLGVAIDIGTTTLAAVLFDLRTGVALEVASCANPQSTYGDDVMNRLEHGNRDEANRHDLQARVVGGINQMIGELLGATQQTEDQLVLAMIAANTAMTHLLLGWDPHALSVAPFIATDLAAVELAGRELGLHLAPGGRVRTLPCMGPYLGSDITAGILACDFLHSTTTQLLVDVGTNGEIVLVHQGALYACSTAAGPAFEGARIHQGMRAADGAIVHAFVDERDLHIEVLGTGPAKGICGTGLLDVVACLLETGVVDETGAIQEADDLPDVPSALRARLGEQNDAPAIRLKGNVWLLQRDIRELQLAKAAIAAGIRCLLDEAGVRPEQLDAVQLAGGFGTDLRPSSAVRVGLLPALPLERVHGVGNTALAGARLALLNRAHRATLDAIPARVRCVSLAGSARFSDAFMDEMLYPEPT